jgi:AbrB family looped-hinge helix DNA binding protein
MRITSKGQVTIPVRIREQAGLMPNTEVEFACGKDGDVRLFRAARNGKHKTRGEKPAERRRNLPKLTTEEIMKLTRGERLVRQLTGAGDIPLTGDEVMAMTRSDPD